MEVVATAAGAISCSSRTDWWPRTTEKTVGAEITPLPDAPLGALRWFRVLIFRGQPQPSDEDLVRFVEGFGEPIKGSEWFRNAGALPKILPVTRLVAPSTPRLAPSRPRMFELLDRLRRLRATHSIADYMAEPEGHFTAKVERDDALGVERPNMSSATMERPSDPWRSETVRGGVAQVDENIRPGNTIAMY